MKFLDYLFQTGYNDEHAGSGTGGMFSIPATFKVNLESRSVPVEYPDSTGKITDHYLSDALHLSRFQLFDNFLIQAVGVSVSKPFHMVEHAVKIKFGYNDDEGNDAFFPGLGNTGILIPALNRDIPVDIAYSPRTLGFRPPRRIGATICAPDDTPLHIDMFDIPSCYDGFEFPVSVYMRILHNADLRAYDG